jgi:transcriptional regulator with AAA-type ATPase domain
MEDPVLIAAMTGSRALTTAVMGTSTPMRALRQQLLDVACRDEPVLLVGEPGLGAELIAELIHRCSPRAEQPLVMFCCRDLPATVVLSELFGHARGSFPGAYRNKQGLVWKLRGGTLWLDGLHETSAAVQGAVWQFALTGRAQPLGAIAPIEHTRARIIAATGPAVPFSVEGERAARPVQLRIPSLRERGEDLRLLLRHFLQEASTAQGTTCPTLSVEVERQLLAYHWPRNLHQLQAVARLLTLRHASMITVSAVNAAQFRTA